MEEKFYVTEEGLNDLKNELETLIHVTRNEVIEELKAARAQGDLSENADYDAARAKQAEVEGRIKELEYILNNAEIIEENNKKGNRVALGHTVTLKFLETGEEKEYTIVGSVESDPFNGKISNSCPLGAAIVGKAVNDVIEVKAQRTYKVQIVKIGK